MRGAPGVELLAAVAGLERHDVREVLVGVLRGTPAGGSERHVNLIALVVFIRPIAATPSSSRAIF